MRKIPITLLTLLALAATAPASAALYDLAATIDGSQVASGSTSAATGSATMTYDDVSDLFSWNINWSGLEGNITVAHFHGPAGPGSNAGVQVNFGDISGLTSPSIGSTTISDLQGADLLAGLWYINIHSTLYPGGEIRGQVQVVPLPAAVWLFGTALAGLGLLRRRKLD